MRDAGIRGTLYEGRWYQGNYMICRMRDTNVGGMKERYICMYVRGDK